jgi:hypothetical protein
MSDLPPEDGNLVVTSGGCGRRILVLGVVIAVLGVAAAVVAPQVIVDADAFGDAGNELSGQVRVGQPFLVGLGSPADAVDLRSAVPRVRADSAPAVADVLVCDDPNVEGIGAARGLGALSRHCGTPRPVPGTRLDPDGEDDPYLVLIVVPLAPGEVQIDGVDVTHRSGWRDVTEHTGPRVVVRVR